MILAMRGVKRKMSGNKRRGGYSRSQIEDVLTRLSHLQNVWVDFGDVPVFEQEDGKGRKKPKRIGIQSRAVVITDAAGQRKLDGTVEATTFLYCPGKLLADFLLGAGHTTARLSIRALGYNPRIQRGEKRMARYFAWQWRVRAYQSDYEIISEGTRYATELAALLNAPILAICHRNREGNRSGGGLHSAKGTGDLEYEAWTVLDLHRNMEDREDSNGEVVVKAHFCKNRSKGLTVAVELKFSGRLQSFRDA